MKKNASGPCPPKVRKALDQIWCNDRCIKGLVLYADELLRGDWGGRFPRSGSMLLNGMDADGFVTEAYVRIATGKRRLRTRWDLPLDEAVMRLVERTIRSLAYNARRRQRLNRLSVDDDGRIEHEPTNESTPDFPPSVLDGLFAGDSLEDAIGRRVLAFEERGKIAEKLGIEVRQVYRIVSASILPRVKRALEAGLLESGALPQTQVV